MLELGKLSFSSSSEAVMEDMVEVVIDSVRVSLTNQQRIVVLRQVGDERYLPIWIGPYEAEAITIALQEIEVARPQTHDLLKSFISAFSARLVRVEVISLKDDVFYGNLVIEANGKTINIDSRPSDALALSVRMNVPILVSQEVMDSAGVMPDKDLQNESNPENLQTPDSPQKESIDKENEERLSVFEDFLNKIGTDGPAIDGNDDPDKPEDDDITGEEK
jgi:uncharacterized protein